MPKFIEALSGDEDENLDKKQTEIQIKSELTSGAPALHCLERSYKVKQTELKLLKDRLRKRSLEI